MKDGMERFFCVGLAPLVALMAADREAAEERADTPAPRPLRRPSPAPAEHGVEAAYTAHF